MFFAHSSLRKVTAYKCTNCIRILLGFYILSYNKCWKQLVLSQKIRNYTQTPVTDTVAGTKIVTDIFNSSTSSSSSKYLLTLLCKNSCNCFSFHCSICYCAAQPNDSSGADVDEYSFHLFTEINCNNKVIRLIPPIEVVCCRKRMQCTISCIRPFYAAEISRKLKNLSIEYVVNKFFVVFTTHRPSPITRFYRSKWKNVDTK